MASLNYLIERIFRRCGDAIVKCELCARVGDTAAASVMLKYLREHVFTVHEVQFYRSCCFCFGRVTRSNNRVFAYHRFDCVNNLLKKNGHDGLAKEELAFVKSNVGALFNTERQFQAKKSQVSRLKKQISLHQREIANLRAEIECRRQTESALKESLDFYYYQNEEQQPPPGAASSSSPPATERNITPWELLPIADSPPTMTLPEFLLEKIFDRYGDVSVKCEVCPPGITSVLLRNLHDHVSTVHGANRFCWFCFGRVTWQESRDLDHRFYCANDLLKRNGHYGVAEEEAKDVMHFSKKQLQAMQKQVSKLKKRITLHQREITNLRSEIQYRQQIESEMRERLHSYYCYYYYYYYCHQKEQ